MSLARTGCLVKAAVDRTDAGADRDTVDRAIIGLGQTRRGPFPQLLAVVIQD